MWNNMLTSWLTVYEDMNNQTTSVIHEFSDYLINHIPEFQELIQARKNLNDDPVSKQLWQEKEEQRETIELMKKKGLPISIEQEEKLSLKLKEMRENPITMRYLKAINFASKISGKIGADLEEAIGVSFTSRKGCK